ncbi:MAG: LysE family transporter, partial [Myxococcota bacterium]
MEHSSWFAIAAVCAAGAVSPGPSLAVVVKNTVRGGRVEGVFTGLGHGIGVGIYAFGAVVGISVLVASTP